MQAWSWPVGRRQRAMLACAALSLVTAVGWWAQRGVEPGTALWAGAGAGMGGGAVVQAFPGRLLAGQRPVRLQVVAASDHPLDQAAKLAVRDALLPVLHRLYREAPPSARHSAAAWLAYVQQHGDQLLTPARRMLELGPWPPWPVRVETREVSFEGGARGAAADAAGSFLTVRVVIGPGLGHNWWCVAFPLLCPAPRPDASRAEAAQARRGPAEPGPPATEPGGRPGSGRLAGAGLDRLPGAGAQAGLKALDMTSQMTATGMKKAEPQAGTAVTDARSSTATVGPRRPWWWRWWPGNWW